MPLLAKLHDNGRTAERHQVDADATLRTTVNSPFDVLIADLSKTGCLFICAELLELNALVTIGIGGIGMVQARIVRGEGQRYGAVFTAPLTNEAVAAALALPSDTIIAFPLWTADSAVYKKNLHKTIKLSGTVRVAVVMSLVIIGWATFIGVVALVR